jgi:hypothetical protein
MFGSFEIGSSVREDLTKRGHGQSRHKEHTGVKHLQNSD